MTITYEWRGGFDNAAVDALHAEGFGHRIMDIDWLTQVRRHSLGWVCAAVCEWLHVDFDDELRDFYFDDCGFAPTNAGLIAP
ncbi:hypothetical protein [Streptomyces sp. NPDC059009]|uniref:hypothetical protein n=1 Tax=Streptomyces sp. NPDC059009 TaxID=3346694 RepID=UPI003696EDE3